MTGLVYKSTGSWYVVKGEGNTFVKCRMKGKFRIKGIKSTNPIAVGDVVEYKLEEGSDEVTGVIHEIKKRDNYIVRRSVNLSKQTHIIASNVDVVFLIVTVSNPVTSTTFIDRFLVTAEAYSIKAVLLFNKIDLLDEDTEIDMLYLKGMYSSIGYECLEISAKENIGIEKVKELMVGKVSMFSGHSGVGKSTLVNTIDPSLNLKTKSISESHQQGQHTTTFAEMFDLSFDAKIIDTPGIRGFGIVDMEKDEIGDYFPEIFALKQDCKFNNCLHDKEPHCAVKNALDNDEIFFSRYKTYLQLLEGDENYRTDIWAEEK